MSRTSGRKRRKWTKCRRSTQQHSRDSVRYPPRKRLLFLKRSTLPVFFCYFLGSSAPAHLHSMISFSLLGFIFIFVLRRHSSCTRPAWPSSMPPLTTSWHSENLISTLNFTLPRRSLSLLVTCFCRITNDTNELDHGVHRGRNNLLSKGLRFVQRPSTEDYRAQGVAGKGFCPLYLCNLPLLSRKSFP